MRNISVITTTFNAAATLSRCLASLAEQTVPFEHIIIDGGSTDGTIEIIRDYAQTANALESNRKVRFISEPDHGLYDALNKGIRMATGDIFGFLHGDDFYPDAKVLARVAHVFDEPGVEACYGDLVYIAVEDRSMDKQSGNHQAFQTTDRDQNIRIKRYWRSGTYSPQKFYWGWMPPHPTFFVCSQVYERHGLFRLDLGTAADYELMLRFLLKYRIQCRYLPHILVHMRTGGVSNASLSNRLRANRKDRQAWTVNGLRPYPWTIPLKPLRKIPQYFLRH